MTAEVKSLLSVLLGAFLTAAGSAQQTPSSQWYRISTESGAFIGYSSQEALKEAYGRDIVETHVIDAGEEHGPLVLTPWNTVAKDTTISRRTIRREDVAGKTTSISSELLIGRDWRRDSVRVLGSRAEITHQTPAESRTLQVLLPPDVRFDFGDDLLPTFATSARPLEFQNFSLSSLSVERVSIEPASGHAADRNRVLVRKAYQGGNLVEVEWITLDDEGRISRIVQPMFGGQVVLDSVDRGVALRTHSVYRPLVNVMTRSPYRISPSAMRGHIRYRFRYKDDIHFTLPQTAEQKVTSEADSVTLDICEQCGPGLPVDHTYLADALRATAWLQSDRPEVKAIADPVARLSISDAQKMDMLLNNSRPYLGTVDFTGQYSALETLSRRAGDCTEAAALLAALGRAAGIPTRVANGLVYSRESYHGVANAWMPHSWTVAWVDGHWRSFDLALDKFDSTHIALTIGDGDERSLLAAGQLAGLLTWDGMAEVKSPPAQ